MGAAPTPRPTAPQPHFSNFPKDLLDLERWVSWRFGVRGGSWTKLPLQPSGAAAKANDPATWAPFAAAKAAYDRGGFDGLGFQLGAGIVGVDLDWKAYSGPGIPPEASDIIGALASYTEFSPSGKGVHVLVPGEWRDKGLRCSLNGDLSLEVYGAGRFFTMTGNLFPGAPAELKANQPALDALAARYARTAPKPARSSRPASSPPRKPANQPAQPAQPPSEALAIPEALAKVPGLVADSASNWRAPCPTCGSDRAVHVTQAPDSGRLLMFSFCHRCNLRFDKLLAALGLTRKDVGLGIASGRYAIKDNELRMSKPSRDGLDWVQLANFAAQITREIELTDGQEATRAYELTGEDATGRPFPPIRVAAEEFPTMRWPAQWSARAVIAAGQGLKDHARAAIQLLSQPSQARVFTHLGWASQGQEKVFLHALGALGASGFEVDVGRPLSGFVLPDPPAPEAAKAAVRQALQLVNLATPEATWPLMLAAFGTPLRRAPFALYLSGSTGVRKTALALVIQSFFGYHAAPPAGWESTVNALEDLAFRAKDCLLLIDDYAPGGSYQQQAELRNKAARLIRSNGNSTGRGRLDARANPRPARIPRASLLITGEDIPLGHSLRARTLVLPLHPGDVDLAKLSAAQALAQTGTLATAMASWLAWLAPRLEEERKLFDQRATQHRRDFPPSHGRTVDAGGWLMAAAEAWLAFAGELGAISPLEASGLRAKARAAIRAVALAQGEHQAEADPVPRALELLSAALSSGRAHLMDAKDPEEPPENAAAWGWQKTVTAGEHSTVRWDAKGLGIGWLTENEVLLEPAAAYKVITEMAGQDPLGLGQPALFKAWAERGFLRRSGDGRPTVTARIAGRAQRVAAFPLSVFTGPATEPANASAPAASDQLVSQALDQQEVALAASAQSTSKGDLVTRESVFEQMLEELE